MDDEICVKKEIREVHQKLEQIVKKHGIRMSEHLTTFRATPKPQNNIPEQYFTSSDKMATRLNMWKRQMIQRASGSRILAQAVYAKESEKDRKVLSGELFFDSPKEREIRTWFFSLSMEKRQQLFIKPSDAESPLSDKQLTFRIGGVYARRYAPDSAELRARNKEIRIKQRAWTGKTPVERAEAQRYDNARKAWEPYRLASSASSSSSPIYKTFDEESQTIVKEFWFCSVDGCNVPGLTTFERLKVHIKKHHADLATYDFDVHVSPTVREIKDQHQASRLAAYPAEAQRVAFMELGVVEKQSVYYCAARDKGCDHRYPLYLIMAGTRPNRHCESNIDAVEWKASRRALRDHRFEYVLGHAQ